MILFSSCFWNSLSLFWKLLTWFMSSVISWSRPCSLVLRQFKCWVISTRNARSNTHSGSEKKLETSLSFLVFSSVILSLTKHLDTLPQWKNMFQESASAQPSNRNRCSSEHLWTLHLFLLEKLEFFGASDPYYEFHWHTSKQHPSHESGSLFFNTKFLDEQCNILPKCPDLYFHLVNISW